MTPFGEYIAGRGETPSRRELNRLIERHGWFTSARRARALLTGEPDAALALPLMFWGGTLPPDSAARNWNEGDVLQQERHCERNEMECGNPKQEAGLLSHPVPRNDGVDADTVDVIDRFIERGGYRIVPTDDAYDVRVDIDIDPEMVSEELAEIYLSQGLAAEAEKIYTMLNLRNS